MGLGAHLKAAVGIAKGLVRTMLAYDADLVEINPLAIVREAAADGALTERLVCLDAKVTLDDSALPRHPQLEALRDPDEEDPADREAREAGLTFIKLDGTIGCMVNGAGLAMTTMDLVKRAGGERRTSSTSAAAPGTTRSRRRCGSSWPTRRSMPSS